jgi:hypothetical protein
LHYVEAGEGPLVVLLHGARVLERLAAANPAARGSGISRRRTRHARLQPVFFDLPDLPESIVRANHWHSFRHFLRDAHPAYTPEEIDRYIEAWSQPGSASGMINYYRSSVRTSPKKAEAALRPISAPTCHLGERDRYLGSELAELCGRRPIVAAVPARPSSSGEIGPCDQPKWEELHIVGAWRRFLAEPASYFRHLVAD